MQRSELEGLKINELRAIAANTEGVEVSVNDNKESLITKILLQDVRIPNEPEAPESEPTESKQQSAPLTTIEEVKAAVNPFILRGLKLFHNAQDNTWLMRIKLKPMVVRDTNSGESRMVDRWRDDSGTLYQPLEAIKRCARVLMSNAPTPREIAPERNPADGYEAVS